MATAQESQFGSTPLYGKTAVIVGGGRGMGRATARKLASAGAKVVVAARTKTDLDGVVFFRFIMVFGTTGCFPSLKNGRLWRER